ncbi:Uncharacterized protein Fot_43152 [Forsythia ovata]|uniref:Uncharacterized protein n=1 Tax=Forsythia ovata TaxID=205694 RepID=A0ABD1RN76_9LAMI
MLAGTRFYVMQSKRYNNSHQIKPGSTTDAQKSPSSSPSPPPMPQVFPPVGTLPLSPIPTWARPVTSSPTSGMVKGRAARGPMKAHEPQAKSARSTHCYPYNVLPTSDVPCKRAKDQIKFALQLPDKIH